MQQQMQTACECGAEGAYQELKDVPMTEQYSRLQEPDMQQKMGAIMQRACRTPGCSEPRASMMAGVGLGAVSNGD